MTVVREGSFPGGYFSPNLILSLFDGMQDSMSDQLLLQANSCSLGKNNGKEKQREKMMRK